MSNWYVHLQAKHSLTALVALRPAEQKGNSHFQLSLQGRLIFLQKTTSSLYTAAVCNCMFLISPNLDFMATSDVINYSGTFFLLVLVNEGFHL